LKRILNNYFGTYPKYTIPKGYLHISKRGDCEKFYFLIATLEKEFWQGKY